MVSPIGLSPQRPNQKAKAPACKGTPRFGANPPDETTSNPATTTSFSNIRTFEQLSRFLRSALPSNSRSLSAEQQQKIENYKILIKQRLDDLSIPKIQKRDLAGQLASQLAKDEKNFGSQSLEHSLNKIQSELQKAHRRNPDSFKPQQTAPQEDTAPTPPDPKQEWGDNFQGISTLFGEPEVAEPTTDRKDLSRNILALIDLQEAQANNKNYAEKLKTAQEAEKLIPQIEERSTIKRNRDDLNQLAINLVEKRNSIVSNLKASLKDASTESLNRKVTQKILANIDKPATLEEWQHEQIRQKIEPLKAQYPTITRKKTAKTSEKPDSQQRIKTDEQIETNTTVKTDQADTDQPAPQPDGTEKVADVDKTNETKDPEKAKDSNQTNQTNDAKKNEDKKDNIWKDYPTTKFLTGGALLAGGIALKMTLIGIVPGLIMSGLGAASMLWGAGIWIARSGKKDDDKKEGEQKNNNASATNSK